MYCVLTKLLLLCIACYVIVIMYCVLSYCYYVLRVKLLLLCIAC